MLTDTKIRATKPRPKAYKLTDNNRLFLFVSPTGGKLWRWSYRFDGKQKVMSFGPWPKVSLGEARLKRDEAHEILKEMRDPAVVRKLRMEEALEASRRTFERIARQWFEMNRSRWAVIQQGDVIRSLERDVFKTIGSLPIAEISLPLVLAVLRGIEARGAIETAKRVRHRISAVFVFAIALGIVKEDPAEKLGAVLQPLRKGRQPAITDLVPLRRMSENAIGYLLNRAGYHGHHVPHGFRAAFSTIMNEWAEREGKEHDRKVIDLMLAHVPKEKIESVYNRAAYLPRRRELASVWADLLCDGLPDPIVLVERPSRETGDRSRRRAPSAVEVEFRFPTRRRAARHSRA